MEEKQWKINKRKYDNEYDKENYKQYKAKMKPDEMDKINKLIKDLKLNKRSFLLKAYETLKKEGK